MSDWKVGDEVFCTFRGFGIVKSFEITHQEYPVRVKFITKPKGIIEDTEDYLIDGREFNYSLHPSLFKSPKEASEYFANIKQKKVFKGVLVKGEFENLHCVAQYGPVPDDWKILKEFEIEYEE